MVKNTTGGKGHRSQRADDPKAAKNRKLVDEWIHDMGNTFPTGTLIGRIVKRLGNGRMEVFAQDEHKKIHAALNVPLRGGMTGRAKRSMWVDVGKLVLIAETGLGVKTHEIFAVLEPGHTEYIKRFGFDPRFFAAVDAPEGEDAGFEFTVEEEINIEDI
jgi:hypothetical protein